MESQVAAAKKDAETAYGDAQKAKLDLTTARANLQKKDQDYEGLESKYLEVYKENIMLKSSQNYKI